MTRRAGAALALTAAAGLVVLLDPRPPLRPLVVGAFLLLAPGAALLSRTYAWPPLVWLTAVIATSLSVDVLLSSALFYLRLWSPGVVLACLTCWCLACLGARVTPTHWRRRT